MKKKRKSDKLTTVILIIVFLAGLSLLLYPSVSNLYNSMLHAQTIGNYTQQMGALEEDENFRLFQDAQAHNAALLSRNDQHVLPAELAEGYWSMLDPYKVGIMAYIEIPVIGVTLPIGHGTGDDVLQKSVGHLEWTSLPVGGVSSHCVLSGHRGLPSSELFTNIDHMEVGDRFYIHVLDRTLIYQVDNIAVVEPDDFSLLGVEEGKDCLTLLTCTPYGINSHRLLVRGVRVDTENVDAGQTLYIPNEVSEISLIYLIPVALLITVAAVCLISLGGKLLGKLRTAKGGQYDESEEENME